MYETIRAIKLQTDMMKEADRRRWKGGVSPWMVMESLRMDKTINIAEGHFIIGIPDILWYLNTDKLKLRVIKSDSTDRMVAPAFYDTDDVSDKHCIIQRVDQNNKKLKLHIFHDDKTDENIYVNESYLKYFDLECKECHLTGTNRKSPVYVWHGADLMGLVLPNNHQEPDDIEKEKAKVKKHESY